ncbi:unnamed protein product [Penicillium olsonii]|nr:unnamed protein product [Penicillium olsonii]
MTILFIHTQSIHDGVMTADIFKQDRYPRASDGLSPVPKVEQPPVPAHIAFELPPPRPPGAAQTERSLHNLTTDMKSLMKKIQDLSHLGIEDQQITLPKICVVGDQSTGKSSLIEAISEIQVPRAEGTCTRCPLEINLTQSEEPWKCVIFLCYRYQYAPKGTNKFQKRNPLGPWDKMQDQESDHFAELTDKNEVTKAILCAQLAILNPRMNPKAFTPDQDPQLSHGAEVKFSPNAVRLDISGPGYPNLSFYDLPGVISQAEQDNESYLVNLVENLVKTYVKQDYSIVLLTLPMTDDATNSSAARLVRDIPGAKERTLGVLTKPDRRSMRESFGPWEEILQGVNFKLGHGYYVVRNNPDISVDHEQARMEERLFFAGEPWSTRLTALEERFGVKNVVTALSDLLKRQIIGSLPSIVAKIDKKLKSIDEELERLPNPPTEDVQRILWGKITDLERRIHELFDGTSPLKAQQTKSENKPLQEQWKMIVLDLQVALQQTRPVLQVSAQKDKEDLAEHLHEEYEVLIIESKSSPAKKRRATAEATQEEMRTKSPSPKNSSPYATPYFEGYKPAHFSLHHLSELKNRSHMFGVPNQLDPRAIETLNKKTVKHWDSLLETFLKAAHGLVHGMLLEALESEFVQYHQTGLYQELSKILKKYMLQVRTSHLKTSKDWCKSELEVPFTMSQELYQVLMAKSLKELQSRRNNSRASTYLQNRGVDLNDEKIGIKIKRVIDEDLLGADRYSEEIKMMAVCVENQGD